MKSAPRMVLLILFLASAFWDPSSAMAENGRKIDNFGSGWHFHLGDVAGAHLPGFDDSEWRRLDLPHDWSIEGAFSEDHPTGPQGGGLPAGIGWYRKTFDLPAEGADRHVFIDFDGVYRNSEVWINGHHLGRRPYGYISFRYELTEHLDTRGENVIAVRVDNADQPNSRWYSGSGIYRNVWLTTTGPAHVDHWGTFVTTPEITDEAATVRVETAVSNRGAVRELEIETKIRDVDGRSIASRTERRAVDGDALASFDHVLRLDSFERWSLENPTLYRVETTIRSAGEVLDRYETGFGIRDFRFDRYQGFFLNGESVKIKGVNMHHDLGALGAAVNTRAIERQLEILREMGVNAIRTAHNPPAPEFLHLTDHMGFIVMNEAFDSWKLMKTEYARYDYHVHWDEWHERDLRDFVRRDRNHPSVIMWSIGNEVAEQFQDDELGIRITTDLARIVRSLDTTRVITAGSNNPNPENPLVRAGVLDVLGFNYYAGLFPDFLDRFPDGAFIATETTAPLNMRGHYKMPSDVMHIWPPRDDYAGPDPDHDNQTASSYDNSYAAFGSRHQDAWRFIRDHDFLSGMFIWSGFDYLGEPTPYGLPARSSYFGVIDLAGFPKDPFYLYKSEWTDEPVLHVFPHWNWDDQELPDGYVDVWAYSNFREVELYLNGESLGVQRKTGVTDTDAEWRLVRRGHTRIPDREIEDFHYMWRVPYQPGTVRAIARDEAGKAAVVREIHTAGPASRIELQADRTVINADGEDLSFITVRVVDDVGNLDPWADHLMHFEVEGAGVLVATDNGDQRSFESFQAPQRSAFHGKALVIIRSNGERGSITLSAAGEGLKRQTIRLAAE